MALAAERVLSPTANGWASEGVRIILHNELYRGVIVEGASGRLVWRANVWQASIEIGDAHERFRIAPARLFENIEHAVPAALTTDSTNEKERHR